MKIDRDKEGRRITIELEIDNCSITITNIYAPNLDKPEFFTTLFDKLNKIEVLEHIVGGDYNVVLDPKMDSKDRRTNNNKAQAKILQFLEEDNFCDVYRLLNPEGRRFTYFKRNPFSAARLDYFLATYSLMGQINEYNVENVSYSDHNLIAISISLSEFRRGPGMWKLNTRLLQDEQAVEAVSKIIRNMENEFQHLDPHEWWEEMKLKVQAYFRQLGKDKSIYKSVERLKKIAGELESELEMIHTRVKAQDSVDKIYKRIEELEDELTQSAIFRSQAKWVKEGERNTRYFLSLERRKSSMKILNRIYRSDGSVITEQSEILKEMSLFYQTLYTRDNSYFDIQNTTGIKLGKEDMQNLEEVLKEDEIYKAICEMKPNKTPGNDGLPVEFYQTFWRIIKDRLIELYEFSLQRGELHQSGRRGVISLLPKGDKDPTLLKNWRPLTLLNVDYKILAKALATRLKKILPSIIGPQQTGFMEGRQISENISKTVDVIAYANIKRKKLLIMSIDFEKCFDQISYSAIFGSMTYFGIGLKYQAWIRLFFTKFEVFTQNLGIQSTYFTKFHSINQGCPVSPYLYLLSGEILAHCIYANDKIKGITVGELKLLLSQFADDTVLYLNFDLDEIDAVVETLTYVENQTGLKISYDKTTVYRIGSLKNTDAKLVTQKELKWSDGNINILGVTIANGNPTSNGYSSTIEKMRKTCETWYYQMFTLSGKVLIINSLMTSLFVYKMMVLPKPNKHQLKSIENICRDFLWKGGKAKLSMELLCNPKNNGGLKLVDFNKKFQSIKIGWISKIIGNPALQYVYYFLIPTIKELIWSVNLAKGDVPKIISINSQWQEILCEWCDYYYRDENLGGMAKDQIIWLNSNIRINEKPVLNIKCIKAGLMYVGDLIHEENDSPLSFEELTEKLSGCVNWLEYHQLVKAVTVNRCFTMDEQPTDNISRMGSLAVLCKTKKPVSIVYNLLINRNADKNLVGKLVKYQTMVNEDITTEDYCTNYNNLYMIARDAKARDFQYRQLSFILFTNTTLHRWQLVDSSFCNLCKKEILQDVKHLFWECTMVQPLYSFLNDSINNELNFNLENIFLCTVIESVRHIANYLTLHLKMYIYSCKCMDEIPTVQQFKVRIKQIRRIEKYNCIGANQRQNFERRWSDVKI